MNQIKSYKKIIFILLAGIISMQSRTLSPHEQKNKTLLQNTETIFQQFERSIANLTEELLKYSQDIDELVPLLLEICLAYWASNIVIQKKATPRRSIKTILKRIGIGYLIKTFATIAHETGHALAAKLYRCKNIQVNIGTDVNHKNNLQTKIGPITYTIQSLYTTNGKTRYTTPIQGLTQLQKAFIAISGGSAATAAIYIMKVVLYLQQNRHKKYNSHKERIKEALHESLTLDSVSASELINMLVPLDEANDGSKFWKALYKNYHSSKS